MQTNISNLVMFLPFILDIHHFSTPPYLLFHSTRVLTSDGSNHVRSSMFNCLKLKIGRSSSITNRQRCSRTFDFRDSLMSNLVNLVKALLGSMLDFCSFEAKNRVFKLDHQ